MGLYQLHLYWRFLELGLDICPSFVIPVSSSRLDNPWDPNLSEHSI
jgi:hypothetical protein